MPGYHHGRAPRNKGVRYPADPPTIEEIVTVMRAAGDGPNGARLRALIVLLWRAGLRISEALTLAETDLDRTRGPCSCAAVRAAGGARWEWIAGPGSSSTRGFGCAARCQSGRFCV